MIKTDARYTVYIDKAYRNYCNTYPDAEKTFQYEGSNIEVRRLTHEEFINNCQTDDDFANRFGCKIVIKELSLEERYHIWFTNNYETGMERYFDPNNIPNFDDAYYESTPTKLKTIIYKDKTIESYE